MIARLCRGLIALVVLVGILAGLPWALLELGTPYLLTHLPSVAEVAAAFYGIQDGRLLLGGLVAAGWFAWLHLVYATIAELVAALRHRPETAIPAPRRAGRALTGLLVMWLMAAFASQATAAPASAESTVASAPAWIGSESETAIGPKYRVRERDTLWDIASTQLGDPLRWREIFDLNAGREQPDGGRLTTSSVLRTGWVLHLPVLERPEAVTVRPGDSLAAIAARTLHDPTRFPELYDANRGLPQPDGGALSDPNVIRPGWLIRVPGSAPEVAPPPPRAEPPPVTITAPSGPSPTTTPPAPRTTPIAPTPTPLTPTRPSDPAPASGSSSWSIVEWGGAGLAAAGVLTALGLLRRRQQRMREYRHQIAVPAASQGRSEVAANSVARPSDADLVTRALGSIRTVDDPPDLQTAMLGPQGLETTFAEDASLPRPFLVGESARTWLFPRTSDPTPDDDAPNSYPAVVSLAAADGQALLVDLEHHGVVHIGGDPDRARDLLRSIVVELGTSRWADATDIVLNGLEPGLTRLPYSRVRHVADPADAIIAGRTKLRTVADALTHADGGVLTRRRLDPWSDAWVVTVVAIADPRPTDDLAAVAAEIRSGSRRSVVFVIANGPLDLPAYQVHVGTDGTLDAPDLAAKGLRAEQMDARYSADLLDVIGTTYEPDEPVPAATDDDTWATDMAADGAWTPSPPTSDNPWEQTMLFEQVEVPASTTVEEPPPPAPPPAPAADPAAERALSRVEREDPDLDSDLAQWHSADTPSRPLVGILGPPLMRAPGGLPASRQSWFLEIAVYLVLHPRGVSVDKLATDLWPADRQAKEATVRRALVDVRAWAGHPPDDPNDFYLPTGTPGVATQYRLTRFLLDWDLFRRLRKRANARAAAGRAEDALADYGAALHLVRGPILRSDRERGYNWLRNPDQHLDSIIPGWVVDTAHECVDLALAHGELEGARRAVDAARVADPELTHDRPLLDLMRIAHAEGNLAEMREHADLLLAERGFEVGEDLPSESFAVFHELFPHGIDGRR